MTATSSLIYCALCALTISAFFLFGASLINTISMTKEGYIEEGDSVINWRGNSTISNAIGSEPDVDAIEKSAKGNLGEFDENDDYYDDSYSGNNMSTESKDEKVGSVEEVDVEDEDEKDVDDHYFNSTVDLVNQDEEAATNDDGDAISVNDESTFLSLHDSVTLADGKMYELVGDEIYHDKTHFCQGLTYSRSSGILFESNGLYGKSQVCQLNATTGVTIKCHGMKPQYFAEGMQVYGDANEEKLIQITWKENTGFIYDASSLNVIRDFQFTSTRNEGWGICLDDENHEFIVSDGSQFLHFWDVETLEEKRKIEVTRQGGSPARNLNELEFMNGKILANVWHEDVLLVIDPDTGKCESEYDFSSLWPHNVRRKEKADVLNGISISDEVDVIYMTGKLWDRMFKVKLS